MNPIEQPYPGVFVFDALPPERCEALLIEVREQPRSRGGPNSMNKYGFVLRSTLLAEASKLQRQLVKPIVEAYFPDIDKLDPTPYAFVIDYEMKGPRKLDAHFDSSTVTLNICLGGDFTGGDLVMHHGQRRYRIGHKIGQAIVHRGGYVHRAEPLKSGWRSNLILWCSERE